MIFNFYTKNKLRRFLKLIAVLIVIMVILLFAVSLKLPPTANAGCIPEQTDSVESETTKVESGASDVDSVLIDTPILFEDIEYKKFYNIDECTAFVNFVTECSNTLVEAINSNSYTLSARGAMCVEDLRLTDILYSAEFDLARMTSWEQEYYYAAKTWEFLMSHGYSPVIASAIISNMAVETAGGTLDLNPTIYSPNRNYYGLCQWSLKYRPEAADLTFEEQLEYLHTDMEKEFNVFGNCYKQGFTYTDFLSMEDPAEAAIAFAKVYERCTSDSYSLRKKAAMEVYNYFMS